ncbi:hypothetical protein [Hymenobacter wooponensis]|uniref:Lipoprotein n=1 Tax=Hymenobacter wooponensis TaxID=1525360 RepID=A0A4Z0MST1_9BACT|nr:hypothetical protein [Hymenobacter wooponensis]TGD82490.1 hypothetical protein EU557_01505 [Hymenobacter wooponensis]
MKSIILFSALLLTLAACQSNSTPPVAQEAAAPPKPPVPQPAPASGLEAPNPERIQDSMVTVNGQLHRELTTQALERQMGRPDRIEKGAVECGSQLDLPIDAPEGDWWFYGKTMYEVNGTQALLHSFDVTTGKFAGKLGKLTLDQNTTLEDVRRYYPVSVKQAEEQGTSRDEQTISLPFEYQGEMSDESLSLLFKNGRLQEVEFFFPC